MSLQYVAKTTPVNLLTTQMDLLSPGSAVVGSTITNTTAANANLDAFVRGTYELILPARAEAFGEGAINVWFLRTIDGTNFETGSALLVPKRLPDLVFYPHAAATEQRLYAEGSIPPGSFRVLLKSEVSVRANFASSGNILRVLAYTTADA